jgi:hypothetical protein
MLSYQDKKHFSSANLFLSERNARKSVANVHFNVVLLPHERNPNQMSPPSCTIPMTHLCEDS